MLTYFLCINLFWHGSWSWGLCSPRMYKSQRHLGKYRWNGTMRPPKTCFLSFSTLFDNLDLFQVWSYKRNLFRSTSLSVTLAMQELIWGRFLLSPIPGSYPKCNSSTCAGVFPPISAKTWGLLMLFGIIGPLEENIQSYFFL